MHEYLIHSNKLSVKGFEYFDHVMPEHYLLTLIAMPVYIRINDIDDIGKVCTDVTPNKPGKRAF